MRLRLLQVRLWPIGFGLAIAAVSWSVWATVVTGADEQTKPSQEGLLLHSRASLLLCVEVHDPGLAAPLRSAVEDALLFTRLNDPEWALLQLGDDPGTVHLGCPGGYHEPATGLQTTYKVRPSGSDLPPSPYRVAVFAVSDEVADRAFPNHQFGRAAFEMECSSSHVCAEVSTAIFVREADLDDPEVMYRVVEKGLGIDNETDTKYPKGHPEPDESFK